MGDFHLYTVVILAASFAVFAGASPITGPELSNVIPDSTDGNDAVSKAPRTVYRIDATIEPAWRMNWVVFSIGREIDVLAGEKFVDEALPKHLYAKYFGSVRAQDVEFHGEGIAHLRYNKRTSTIALEIDPLKPGTHHFGYSIKHGDELERHNWTVNSISSKTVQRDSLFEFDLDFPDTPIAEHVKVSNVDNIGVEVRPGGRSLRFHGLANDIQDGSVLAIRMRDSHFGSTTRKVRLLLGEPKKAGKLCPHKKIPCLNQIQLWLKNFNATIQNRRTLAKCVRDGLQSVDSGLHGVRFEEYGSDATFFEAQPSETYLCSYLQTVIDLIRAKCRPREVIGYRLVCGPSFKGSELVDKNMVELSPPAPHIPQTATETNPDANTITDRLTESAQALPESSPTPPTTERPQPDETSPKPEETLPEASRTESPGQQGDISTSSSTSPEPPTTETPEQVVLSSTPSSTPSEPTSTGNPNPEVVTSPTTVETVPVKEESTTPEASQESSSTIAPDFTKVSTTGPEDESSFTPSNVPTSSPSADAITPTGTVAAGDVEMTEAVPPTKGSVASYTSVSDHLYTYAIYLGAIFIILFILIACLSR